MADKNEIKAHLDTLFVFASQGISNFLNSINLIILFF